jgi:hypothetical protein
MTALVATEYSAQIVWLGVITQRKSVELQTEARSFIKIDWNGVLGSATVAEHDFLMFACRSSTIRVLKYLMCDS